jgi:hypothetical protein
MTRTGKTMDAASFQDDGGGEYLAHDDEAGEHSGLIAA